MQQSCAIFMFLACQMNNLQDRIYTVKYVFDFQSIMKTNFEKIVRGDMFFQI